MQRTAGSSRAYEFTKGEHKVLGMYLFFDTETTGLPKTYSASTSNLDNWPRVLQLASLLYDPSGVLLLSSSHIIKPEDFIIPEKATAIHGITNEKANKEGIPLIKVLTEFVSDYLAPAGTIISHNLYFDKKVIGAELLRHNFLGVLAGKKKICTMLGTRNLFAGHKWPSLSELYYLLFHSKIEEAHDAYVDIQATAKCFWELRKKGVL